MAGPLAALIVVDFALLGPAPLAWQLLAYMGASVCVIDRASSAAAATDINRRGKHSIALNLNSEQGRDIAHALIAEADSLIEGFRPGVMERLGLGPDDCPDSLIYGRITGWGQHGPLAQRAGHDLTYLAVSGALSLMGPADRPPAPPLNLVADYGAGTMFLLFGVLSALIEETHERQRDLVVEAAEVSWVVEEPVRVAERLRHARAAERVERGRRREFEERQRDGIQDRLRRRTAAHGQRRRGEHRRCHEGTRRGCADHLGERQRYESVPTYVTERCPVCSSHDTQRVRHHNVPVGPNKSRCLIVRFT